MSSAASATTPAEHPVSRRRLPHFTATRRSGLYLLGGLLLLAAIPIVATVRILDQNALRNARARADATMRLELEAGVRRLGQLGDDVSVEADDLVSSPEVAHSFIVADRVAIQQLARRHPSLVFTLGGRTVAGKRPALAVTRTVWLTVNGTRIGSLVGAVGLDQRLGAPPLRGGPPGEEDRLVIVPGRTVVGAGERGVGPRGQ